MGKTDREKRGGSERGKKKCKKKGQGNKYNFAHAKRPAPRKEEGDKRWEGEVKGWEGRGLPHCPSPTII